MRVECFMNLVSPKLATRAAMVQNTMVEVYPVQAGRTLVPFYEVVVMDWAGLLVAEVSKQGGTRETARHALKH